MLVVNQVIPNGPAFNKLQPGDIVCIYFNAQSIPKVTFMGVSTIDHYKTLTLTPTLPPQLLRVNHVRVTTFTALESLLDDNVGKSLLIEVQRGAHTHSFSITVWYRVV